MVQYLLMMDNSLDDCLEAIMYQLQQRVTNGLTPMHCARLKPSHRVSAPSAPKSCCRGERCRNVTVGLDSDARERNVRALLVRSLVRQSMAHCCRSTANTAHLAHGLLVAHSWERQSFGRHSRDNMTPILFFTCGVKSACIPQWRRWESPMRIQMIARPLVPQASSHCLVGSGAA